MLEAGRPRIWSALKETHLSHIRRRPATSEGPSPAPPHPHRQGRATAVRLPYPPDACAA